MLTKNEISDLIYQLENKHERRLSTDQRNVVFAAYDELGQLPTDAVFVSLIQRDTDLNNDASLKAIKNKEARGRAAQRKRLENLFPILKS